MFSQPSDIYYAKPRKPEPPWNFQVQFMQVNEGAAEVSLSWKKPKRIGESARLINYLSQDL